VAIAFQVVLAMGDVDELTATNLALALNVDCTSCDTAAFAYQFVTGTGGPVHFTAEGNRRLAELRRRLRALRDAGLTDDELAAELDSAAAELSDVLAQELVPAGPPGPAPAPAPSGSEAQNASPPEGEAPTATATPTSTSTPAAPDPPAETPAPTETPTPTETPAPAPTSSPTPTPAESASPPAG
jgi:putative peptide zinc metalloprotease protein